MTVLSCLSLTTVPCSIRFGISLSSLRFFGRALLSGDRLHARDIAAHFAHAAGILQLTRRPLEAQVELLFLELHQLVGELIGAHRPGVAGFHRSALSYSAMRWTKRVFIGSLAAASASASLASCTGTPSSSNRTRPGLTRATQYSTAPLPEPMRTSSGFLDTGTSGNTRIQTRPARFMWRVSARRAASIWRAVRRSGSVAFRPYSPKASEAPLVARPLMRPLCALRNLVFFGCSMIDCSLSLCPAYAASRRGRPWSPSAIFLSCAIGSCSRISPLKIQTFTPQVP